MNKAFNMEDAIERYLNGTMPAAEKQGFMARLEQDHQLRRAVDAELLIRRSVQSNRAAMPAPSRESRARFLAMVATVAPEPSALAPAQVAAAGKGSSLLGYIAGSGLAKGVIATMAGAALTIGTVVMIPKSDGRDATTQAPAIEKVQPGTAPANTGSVPVIPSTPALPNVADAPAPSTGAGQEQQEVLNAQPRETAISLRPPTENRQAPKQSAETISSSSTALSTQRPTAPELQADPDDERDQVTARTAKDLPTVTADSVAVRFNLKKPTIKR